MARATFPLVLLIVLGGVCLLRPDLPLRWAAVLVSWSAGSLGGRRPAPRWVNHYLGRVPGEAPPREARVVEEWLRIAGLVVLATPVGLFLMLLAFQP